jgi:biopolymer transport protein ExbB
MQNAVFSIARDKIPDQFNCCNSFFIIGGIMSFFKRIPALLVAAVLICAPAVTAIVALNPATAMAQAPAAEAPAPAAAPAAPAVGKESVANPYGLSALWNEGDFVSKGTLIILVIMSMGSWYILIVKLFEQFRLMKESKEVGDDFWNAGSLQQGTNALKDSSAFRFIAESGLKASSHHQGLLGDVDLNEWVTMSIQRASENVNNRLQDGLAFLATVGSTAPFVGLFGTVWGIYHALTAIGIAGQASIDKVAGPVGEALIMTAFGLAVAVPAVLSYNWLVRRNKVAMEKVRAFSADVHSVLMSGGGGKKR